MTSNSRPHRSYVAAEPLGRRHLEAVRRAAALGMAAGLLVLVLALAADLGFGVPDIGTRVRNGVSSRLEKAVGADERIFAGRTTVSR